MQYGLVLAICRIQHGLVQQLWCRAYPRQGMQVRLEKEASGQLLKHHLCPCRSSSWRVYSSPRPRDAPCTSATLCCSPLPLAPTAAAANHLLDWTLQVQLVRKGAEGAPVSSAELLGSRRRTPHKAMPAGQRSRNKKGEHRSDCRAQCVCFGDTGTSQSCEGCSLWRSDDLHTVFRGCDAGHVKMWSTLTPG